MYFRNVRTARTGMRNLSTVTLLSSFRGVARFQCRLQFAGLQIAGHGLPPSPSQVSASECFVGVCLRVRVYLRLSLKRQHRLNTNLSFSLSLRPPRMFPASPTAEAPSCLDSGHMTRMPEWLLLVTVTNLKSELNQCDPRRRLGVPGRRDSLSRSSRLPLSARARRGARKRDCGTQAGSALLCNAAAAAAAL